MATKTVLITGANRGIGLELARKHQAAGWRVIGTARDVAKATELEAVAEVLPLDVTDPGSIDALAAALEGRAIDRLINNAGVFGPRDGQGGGFDELDYAAWLDTLNANCLGPVRTAMALGDRLTESGQVYTITSQMGSIALTSGNSPIYRSSKTAVNMAMACLAQHWPKRTVALFHPGWVQTDMGGASADLTVEQSAAGLIAVMERLKLADSGGFFNHDGASIPW